MNDVSGSGNGLRGPGKTSRTSDANFEYIDDSEWDVGIGNLIIDLDADIAEATKNDNEATRSNNSGATNNSVASNSPSNSCSPIHSPSRHPSPQTPPTTTQQQMHIPQTSSGNTSTAATSTTANNSGNLSSSNKGNKNSSTSNSNKGGCVVVGTAGSVGGTDTGESGNSMEQSAAVESNKGLKMKIKRTKTGTKSGADEKHEIVKTELATSVTVASGANNSGSSITTPPNSKNNTLNESISSKSAHSSSSHKDKDKIKDGSVIMIDADSIVGSISNHDSSSVSGTTTSTNNGINKDSNPLLTPSTTSAPLFTGNGEQLPQGKNSSGKTPRKGKEPHSKKVKSNNNGAMANKKDERNSNSTESSSKNNSISSSSHTTTTTTPKDGKDYFSTATTVSLNVPTIIPNAKTTIKVSNSITRINLEPHAVAAALDSTTRNHNNSNNATSPYSGSPKGTEKILNSQSQSSLSTEFKQAQGNGSPSYGKKIKSLGGDKDKLNKEDGIGLSSCKGLSAIASSYKNSIIDNSISCISATVNHTAKGGKNSQSGTTQDVCIGTSVGTVTDPDCLGPCDPGTAVTLEGIVWHENENGILVVNVTWRGKTYVGSLIDCTKNDWAPPRFSDSPTSDLEMRTPKNRAKRGRAGQAPTPVSEVQSDLRVGNVKLRNGGKGRRGSATNAAFVAPASPLKGILGVGVGDQWPKRKTRGSENESQDEPSTGGGKPTKKLKVSKEDRNKDRQLNSPVPSSDLEKSSGPSSPAHNLIECPEPNCSKKYKHINGLRYHTSHAHNNFVEDSDSNTSTTSNQLAIPSDGVTVDQLGSELMVIDNSNCDLEENESSSMLVDNESPPPTTAFSKRGGGGSIGRLDDKSSPFDLHDENARLGDNNKMELGRSGELLQDLSLSLSGKSGHKIGNKGHKESGGIDSDSKSFESLSKDTASLPSRPAILTVPSFISLQNRSAVHSHSALSSSRDQDNTVMKPTPIHQAKGIPWQPHVHNPVSSSVHHHPYPHPHSQNSLSSATVTLNIPGDKLKEKSSSESHGKKNKHKKKSKDKDGKSSKSDSRGDKSNGKAAGGGRNKVSNLSPSETLEGRIGGISAANDLRIPSKRDSEHSFSSDGNITGHVGDSREDPQSPAYSDISDANDSGDAELNVGVVVKDGKALSNSDQPKKDIPTIPVSPYFSPFYTPYMEPKLGDKPIGHVAPLEHDQSDKLKTKSVPTHNMQNLPPGPPLTQQHPSLDDNNGRSPKMDFPSPKYLPHQQQPHYFHYPYSNYHFEQSGQFNNVMQQENSFPPRGISMDEREKEKEISAGDLPKSNKHSHTDHRDGINIKQEPGLMIKDGRSLKLQDDKFIGNSEIKSEFGSEPSKSVPHYMQTCSKHSNKDSSKRSGSGDDVMNKQGSDKLRDAEKDLMKEKEKNEGAKPTMETTGPPPPPTAGAYAYIPQPYLQSGSPFGLPFDPGHPLYRNVLVPGPYGGSPYGMHPGPIPRYPPPPSGVTPLPEDLSRSNASQNPSSGAAKALDLLQHHAQYYQVHKIHELSERALKSPSPQVGQRGAGEVRGDPSPGVSPSPNTHSSSPVILSGLGNPSGRSSSGGSGGTSGSPNLSNNKTGGGGDLTKELKLGIGPLPPGGLINESSRSPPTQHHVHSHTHHHTHIGVGYPILPTAFPPPHSPAHYGVLTTPPTTVPPSSAIQPFPLQKPN